jgi:type III secretion system low calcium response chaperone LcrH/SycD
MMAAVSMNPQGLDVGGDLPWVKDLKDRLAQIPCLARFTEEQIDMIYAIAFANYQQGKVETALGIFEVLMIYRPTDARIMLAYAVCCKKLVRFEVAIPAFVAAAFLNPEDVTASVHLAECFAAIGDKQACESILLPLSTVVELDEKYASLKKRVDLLRNMLKVQ